MREEERPEEDQPKEPQAAQATHEDICKGALGHYEELAAACHHWYNAIPKAIEFYREHGGETCTEVAVDEVSRISGNEEMKRDALLLLSEIIKFLTRHGYECIPDDDFSYISELIKIALLGLATKTNAG